MRSKITKLLLLLTLIMLVRAELFSQIITVNPHNNSTSALGRAPTPLTRYQRCYYFISQAEMQTAGFPNGNITSIGFNYSTASTGATADNFRVFLKMVALPMLIRVQIGQWQHPQ
ncbi:MAG: hypothetical protein IPL50_19400 [Chitinophagaceae bacterium]|nr:hypothetical protein [Chitinophagaceae bacterium]